MAPIVLCVVVGLRAPLPTWADLRRIIAPNSTHLRACDGSGEPAPADSADTARTATVRATFDRRHHLDDDLEIVPIPGHTPGATAYLWDTGEHRVLFTGDSLYLRDGAWRAALPEGVSDRETYIASLQLLSGLDFDVLAPGIVSGEGAGHVFTDSADARERIGALIERLRGGGDH